MNLQQTIKDCGCDPTSVGMPIVGVRPTMAANISTCDFDLPPELEPDAVSKLDGLLEGGVHVGVARREHGVAPGVAEGVRSGN